jgi:hypothetical protein
VVVGTHKVWVQFPTTGVKGDPEGQKRLAAMRDDPPIAQMLQKYGSPETTPLTVEVTAGRDIPLALD